MSGVDLTRLLEDWDDVVVVVVVGEAGAKGAAGML